MAPTPQQTAVALMALVGAWRKHKNVQTCPQCQAEHLEIEDLSARPHTEWYRFTCAHCGLKETVSRPMAAPGQSGIN